jgi:hypothetical protein
MYPKLIRFGLKEETIREFTRHICHALSLRLVREHPSWDLVGLCSKEHYCYPHPFHVMAARKSNSRASIGREFIDVRGIWTDIGYYFTLQSVAEGHTLYLTKQKLNLLQEQGQLTPLRERHLRRAEEGPLSEIERMLPVIDRQRPYDRHVLEITHDLPQDDRTAVPSNRKRSTR